MDVHIASVLRVLLATLLSFYQVQPHFIYVDLADRISASTFLSDPSHKLLERLYIPDSPLNDGNSSWKQTLKEHFEREGLNPEGVFIRTKRYIFPMVKSVEWKKAREQNRERPNNPFSRDGENPSERDRNPSLTRNREPMGTAALYALYPHLAPSEWKEKQEVHVQPHSAQTILSDQQQNYDTQEIVTYTTPTNNETRNPLDSSEVSP